MMPDNIEYLPVWKAGATADERLLEVAMMARKHPERFGKLIVVYQEEQEGKRTVNRRASNGCTTNEFVGILQMAIVETIMETKE